MRDLRRAAPHVDPPPNLGDLRARARWVLPAAGASFVALAVLARLDALPWDRPVSDWLVGHRSDALDEVVRAVTRIGSNEVVYVVAAICVVAAWPRCRPLAWSIAVVAIGGPLIVVALKEVVARNRPPVELQLFSPGGYSFPSGHPVATAASWAFIPLVLALYTHRRWIWWASVAVVWSLVVLVSVSRVYLGAHFATDVVGSLLLSVLLVAGSEALIELLHRRRQSAGCWHREGRR